MWYIWSHLLCKIVSLNDSFKILAAVSVLCVFDKGVLRDESKLFFKNQDQTKSLKKI